MGKRKEALRQEVTNYKHTALPQKHTRTHTATEREREIERKNIYGTHAPIVATFCVHLSLRSVGQPESERGEINNSVNRTIKGIYFYDRHWMHIAKT